MLTTDVIDTLAHGWSGRSQRELAVQAALLRCAADQNEARATILAARKEYLERVTLRQRHWQSSVSRRPSRTRHHDTWALRESYVRGGDYSDYLDVARKLGAPTAA